MIAIGHFEVKEAAKVFKRFSIFKNRPSLVVHEKLWLELKRSNNNNNNNNNNGNFSIFNSIKNYNYKFHYYKGNLQLVSLGLQRKSLLQAQTKEIIIMIIINNLFRVGGENSV